jgi:hypothetical protein
MFQARTFSTSIMLMLLLGFCGAVCFAFAHGPVAPHQKQLQHREEGNQLQNYHPRRKQVPPKASSNTTAVAGYLYHPYMQGCGCCMRRIVPSIIHATVHATTFGAAHAPGFKKHSCDYTYTGITYYIGFLQIICIFPDCHALEQ